MTHIIFQIAEMLIYQIINHNTYARLYAKRKYVRRAANNSVRGRTPHVVLLPDLTQKKYGRFEWLLSRYLRDESKLIKTSLFASGGC